MRAVFRSNNPVELSFLMCLLKDAGIGAVMLDEHASLVEGNIGAIPRRIMVTAADEARALRVLADGVSG